jgi:hypothetical protein
MSSPDDTHTATASTTEDGRPTEDWDARGLAYASLPVLAFAVTFAGHATGAFAAPTRVSAVPTAAIVVALVAAALAVGTPRGLALATTAAGCSLLGLLVYLRFYRGGRFTVAQFAEVADVGGLLTLAVVAGVLGPVGYALGGLARWSASEGRRVVLDWWE